MEFADDKRRFAIGVLLFVLSLVLLLTSIGGLSSWILEVLRVNK